MGTEALALLLLRILVWRGGGTLVVVVGVAVGLMKIVTVAAVVGLMKIVTVAAVVGLMEAVIVAAVVGLMEIVTVVAVVGLMEIATVVADLCLQVSSKFWRAVNDSSRRFLRRKRSLFVRNPELFPRLFLSSYRRYLPYPLTTGRHFLSCTCKNWCVDKKFRRRRGVSEN